MRGVLVALLLCACDPSGGDAPPLFINEVMPSNQSAHLDPDGAAEEYDDWLELYNASGEAADLEGYFISDDPTDVYRRRLPAGLEIPARGYLLLYADGEPEQGNAHLPFKLSAAGEQLTLTTSGGLLVDGIEWTDAQPDQSFARFPDGEGEFVQCASSTPGATNGSACASP